VQLEFVTVAVRIQLMLRVSAVRAEKSEAEMSGGTTNTSRPATEQTCSSYDVLSMKA